MADEIGNFEEYTWLYDDAWTTPAVRWLFSTVPLCMLLDDHDLRDDWNTSLTWRRWVTSQPWWHDRVVGAYASYWVYQHLGNLSPEQLDQDPTYRAMLSIEDDDERTAYLDSLRVDGGRGPGLDPVELLPRLRRRAPAVSGWSRSTRAARGISSRTSGRWSTRTSGSGSDGTPSSATHPIHHLLLASTLPFLLAPGLHHLEGWDEAISSGAWGPRGARIGEKIRQGMDLEHWASFRKSFDDVTDLLAELVGGEDPPASILMLSGDVHCSYLAEARLTAVRAPRYGDPSAHHVAVPEPGAAAHPMGEPAARTPAG